MDRQYRIEAQRIIIKTETKTTFRWWIYNAGRRAAVALALSPHRSLKTSKWKRRNERKFSCVRCHQRHRIESDIQWQIAIAFGYRNCFRFLLRWLEWFAFLFKPFSMRTFSALSHFTMTFLGLWRWIGFNQCQQKKNDQKIIINLLFFVKIGNRRRGDVQMADNNNTSYE